MAELLLHIYWQKGKIYTLFHRHFYFAYGTITVKAKTVFIIYTKISYRKEEQWQIRQNLQEQILM